jgi:membrane protease YdiL (CAAX protease family)
MGVAVLFIVTIEKKTFQEIGWKSTNIIRDIAIGVIFSIILLLLSTILMLITQTFVMGEISINLEKFFTVVFFALGAIYEDCLFRGYFQKELEKTYSLKTAILIQATAFLIINLFYFPFNISRIINYIVIFVMAILIGFLANRYSLYSASTAHVLFVLIAGLLV